MSRLQIHPITDDNGFAEGQPWFGAVPIYKFVDGVAIAALRVRTGQTVENCGLRDFKVRQS
jgi:hypothetical protein